MKQILLSFVFMLVSLIASAQQSAHAQVAETPQGKSLYFGYFSYEEVLHTMPGYAIAKHNMDELRGKYDEETKRVETELTASMRNFLMASALMPSLS